MSNRPTVDECEALADIIWFIKGRASANHDKGNWPELGHEHVEALRKFRNWFMDTKLPENKP